MVRERELGRKGRREGNKVSGRGAKEGNHGPTILVVGNWIKKVWVQIGSNGMK